MWSNFIGQAWRHGCGKFTDNLFQNIFERG
ncbi:Uncharacterised protein [Vibrio cholerae]|nr:Uncharacterised protein [Vibrio cholerae]